MYLRPKIKFQVPDLGTIKEKEIETEINRLIWGEWEGETKEGESI